MAKLNLIEAYRQVFGYKAVTFYPLDTTVRVEKAATEKFSKDASSAFNETSFLGTPFFMRTSLDGFKLPNEPIVEISLTKNIIKTPIDGNNGTFKELYSNGDYMITLKGLAINDAEPDNYPEEIVRKLRSIVEKNQSVSITNDLLTFFGVDLVAIESASFGVLEGFPGVQPYEFHFSSDKEFDIELKTISRPLF
jgi:hypothetical protein